MWVVLTSALHKYAPIITALIWSASLPAVVLERMPEACRLLKFDSFLQSTDNLTSYTPKQCDICAFENVSGADPTICLDFRRVETQSPPRAADWRRLLNNGRQDSSFTAAQYPSTDPISLTRSQSVVDMHRIGFSIEVGSASTFLLTDFVRRQSLKQQI